jgi:hypothetical protein
VKDSFQPQIVRVYKARSERRLTKKVKKDMNRMAAMGYEVVSQQYVPSKGIIAPVILLLLFVIPWLLFAPKDRMIVTYKPREGVRSTVPEPAIP